MLGMRALLVLTLGSLALMGCGVSNSSNGCVPNAVPYSLMVAPASGQPVEPDHTAAPPGNQEQFNAIVAPSPGQGCPVPAWVLLDTNAIWTVSDKVNVQISSAAGNGNGLATCVGATDGAATVTATVTFDNYTLTNTSTITCK